MFHKTASTAREAVEPQRVSAFVRTARCRRQCGQSTRVRVCHFSSKSGTFCFHCKAFSPDSQFLHPEKLPSGLHLPNTFLIDWPLWDYSYHTEGKSVSLAIQICTSYKPESLSLSPTLTVSPRRNRPAGGHVHGADG